MPGTRFEAGSEGDQAVAHGLEIAHRLGVDLRVRDHAREVVSGLLSTVGDDAREIGPEIHEEEFRVLEVIGSALELGILAAEAVDDLAVLPVLGRIHVDDGANRRGRLGLEGLTAGNRHARGVQEEVGLLRDLDDVGVGQADRAADPGRVNELESGWSRFRAGANDRSTTAGDVTSGGPPHSAAHLRRPAPPL